MPLKTENLDRWLENDILPNLDEEERDIKNLLKKIEPDHLRVELNKPILKVKLAAMITDTKNEIRELKQPLDALTEVCAGLVECGDCEEEIDQIDVHAREVIETTQILEFRFKTLQELRELVYNHESERAPALEREMNERLEVQLDDWNRKTTRQKFGNDKRYQTFRQRIWEARGSATVMPSVKSSLPREEGDEDEDDSSDEDVAVGGATQSYKCPLCIRYLNDPLTSRICGHALCRGCFDDYLIQQATSLVPCPVSGCTRQFSKADMESDQSLEARAKQAKRRQDKKQAEEDDDSGEDQAVQLESDPGEETKPSQRKKSQASGRRRRILVTDDD